MAQIELTIVTIAKCEADILRQTMSSVDQHVRNVNFEHVLIINKSMKHDIHSLDISTTERSVYVCDDHGIYDAMNRGIAASRGRFLWFLNAGDVAIPETSQFLASVIGDNFPDGKIVSGYTKNVDSEGREVGKWPPSTPDCDLLMGNVVPHQATLIPKSAFIQNGLYDDRFSVHGDYEFWFRCLSNGAKFSYIDQPVASYVLGGRSSSSAWRMQARREHMLILERYKLISAWQRRLALLAAISDTTFDGLLRTWLSPALRDQFRIWR